MANGSKCAKHSVPYWHTQDTLKKWEVIHLTCPSVVIALYRGALLVVQCEIGATPSRPVVKVDRADLCTCKGCI